MNKFSNILKVNPKSDLYLEFMNKLSSKINSFQKKANLPLAERTFNKTKYEEYYSKNLNIEKKIIMKPILNQKKGKNTPTLKSIEDLTPEDDSAILTLKILDIIPRNIIDYTYTWCEENEER